MAIRVLDPKVAGRIAAGEVVERPASVVKELVENSLDAGATRVSVEARGGGVGLIRVTDDGSGIGTDEVETAFGRFATSKLGTADDLYSITTLGFRGEALPSIAAVADVEAITCLGGRASGDFVRLHDGEVAEHRPAGRSTGTTVTVRGLFRAVPARLKFLRSAATENAHIARVVSRYALAFPEVGFTLDIDGRTVLNTPGTGRDTDAVAAVYGAEVASKLLPIRADDAPRWQNGGPEVAGMVGGPDLSRANRDSLSLFVNRRWISSRNLAWAVEEAYQGMLMTGRHPVAIIKIRIPPGEVDVNIHPTKAEVKFRNERAMFAAVQKAVRSTLVESAPLARIEDPVAPYTAPPSARQSWSTPRPAPSTFMLPLEATPTPGAVLPALRVLGQLDSTYIIAEGPDGLYLIDQHAAHERVVYERVLDQQARRQVEVQGLLEPVPLEVTPEQDEVLRDGYKQLEAFGFSIEPFGNRTYLVRSIPAVLGGKEWGAMMREALDAVIEGKRTDWTEDITVTLACHSAIRAGQTLTDNEMRELVRQLEQTGVPRSCPHGRPTVIHLSTRQLEREFRRA